MKFLLNAVKEAFLCFSAEAPFQLHSASVFSLPVRTELLFLLSSCSVYLFIMDSSGKSNLPFWQTSMTPQRSRSLTAHVLSKHSLR